MDNLPRIELIQVAENVAREKSIEKEDVLLAMEEAIQKAARSKYGSERDIRASINRNNGSIKIEQYTHFYLGRLLSFSFFPKDFLNLYFFLFTFNLNRL